MADLLSMDVAAELMERVDKELEPYLRSKEPEMDLPKVQRSRDLAKADLTMLWAPVCARRKIKPNEFTAVLAADYEAFAAANKDSGKANLVARAVKRLGKKFGHTDSMKGKRVVFIRSSDIFDAKELNLWLFDSSASGKLDAAERAQGGFDPGQAGYDVKEAFYVNDLGAQIGLTALAYTRCYHLMKPAMKVDHWIGSMYAIMNTFTELQRLGVDIGEIGDAFAKGSEAAKAWCDAQVAAATDPKVKEGLIEYFDIFQDIRDRTPEHTALFDLVLTETRKIPDIKVEAGKLNLSYERQNPEAIRIFRKMVTDCLSGVQ
eukprot:gene22632-27322_t